MTQPIAGSVHVDSALTNISVAFLQNASNFIANRVFPNVPVTYQSDRYFVYDRGMFNRNEAEVRAPAAQSAGVGYTVDNTPTYFARVFAVHHDVADQVRANADPAIDPERDAAELVAHKLLIRRETDFVNRFMTGGVWTNSFTGVNSSPTGSQTIRWSDQTSGDPIGDIREAKSTVLESTGFEPNTLVMGQRVFDALVDHPDIVDRIKYSGGVGNGNPARVSEQTLAALLGIERVMISKAIVNTAAEGLTNSHSFIAGKNALLCYAAPTPSLMRPSAGYTFSWSGYMGQGNAFGFATSRIDMPWLKATRIEGEMSYDMRVISADLGYYWGSIVV